MKTPITDLSEEFDSRGFGWVRSDVCRSVENGFVEYCDKLNEANEDLSSKNSQVSELREMLSDHSKNISALKKELEKEKRKNQVYHKIIQKAGLQDKLPKTKPQVKKKKPAKKIKSNSSTDMADFNMLIEIVRAMEQSRTVPQFSS